MISKNMRLGDILVNSRLITEEQLISVLELQKKNDKKLGELLIEQGIVEERQIIEVLEFQLGIPHVDLNKYFIDPSLIKLIPENLAKRHTLVAIKKTNNRLVIAMADPLNIFAIDDVKIVTGLDVDVVIGTSRQIKETINKYYDGREFAEKAIEDFTNENEIEVYEETEDASEEDINSAPVVRLVNFIMTQAVKLGASDIHIEPFQENVRIRLRVDGELNEIMTSSKATHSPMVTRIKIMGKLNIAEKRLPQDGRVEMIIEKKQIDMRISVLPTVYGEKVVIRILDRSNVIGRKEELGMLKPNLEAFNKIIQNPNGIILVTGPTGSGKTTTLYTVLKELNQISKNIITVEDPVEYRLEGINQVQVNIKAGLTFASGLRSILRQDPDIVMVGEIRDAETAQISIRAAITGHLVLSTLHTNDTASTIARLIDMGLDHYLVGSALAGIVAQRLVRRVCKFCSQPYSPSEYEKDLLKLQDNQSLYKGKGCNACSYTGYKGRVAVHELMPITKEIRTLINQKSDTDTIKNKAMDHGMLTLLDSCRHLVVEGTTTTEELLKISYNMDM